ncbi:MAG: RIP metalloprotease RseP [Dysgonamonadaceae bacterium]|jgi:regulator of sigma E protease|nr:RIP metalloprotease RseP [Dysgonamonadaceae bacterium]
METILIKALQLVLSLSILVIVHELGHFLFAKLFKTRVEKFYLFFNPWFSIFKFKPKNSETEYGVGWLPLGGYCKISGMIDESMDREAMKLPPQPWEFRSKPAWQRLLIMVGGVLMNFILAFFIYSMIVLAWGDRYIQIDKTPLYFSQVAQNAGFRDGDLILSADGKTLSRYDDLDLFRVISAKEVTVNRGGEDAKILLPEDFKKQFLNAKTPFADYRQNVVDSVVAKSYAEEAGLQTGDQITAINGVKTSGFGILSSILAKHKDESIQLQVVRGDSTFTLPCKVSSEGTIGFTVPYSKPAVVNDTYGFFKSIPAGISLGVRKLKFYVLQMKLVFTREGIQHIGGFGAIGNLFPALWSWPDFWELTAFLSLMLGVMNLLPIPALDGGHVMFLIFEVITGKKPSDKFLEHAQVAGMVFLLLLLLYANGNDILRAMFG